MKTNFFEKEPPKLPTKEFTTDAYGTIVLEKMDYAKTMAYRSLAKSKLEQYSKDVFPPIGTDAKLIDVTQEWADQAAAIVVMQIQPEEERYNFEEIIASSVTNEDEYNLLVLEAFALNQEATTGPKDLDSPA